MFNISNIKIPNSIILAPMAGITDHPFRQICKKFGAGLVYTEFVSADGIIRENQKTLDMIRFKDNERPIGVQIFGDDPDIVARSAAYIDKFFKPDIIDINYGCPVPKVTKKGAGSAALKDLCIMKDITQAVIDSVGSTPVTVKMRTGWNQENIVSTDAGILLESIGVKAITLHARTTSQKFSGSADWEYIKELKKAVKIPVIGNGDVLTFEDYQRMREITECDGVMIGRAALGNPWIFTNILNNNNTRPSILEIKEVCLEHIDLLIKNKSEKTSINLSKKHLSYYLKNFNHAGVYRRNIMECDNMGDIIKNIESIEV